jgi:hypothetical protein
MRVQVTLQAPLRFASNSQGIVYKERDMLVKRGWASLRA